jgi:hypothetical protein
MPIPKETAYDKIGEPSPGDVWVYVNKFGGAKHFGHPTIPLDGRKYRCDGVIIFRNGTSIRAKFSLIASNEEILIDNVICFHNGLWYGNDEDDLFKELQTNRDDAAPMMCLPDRSVSGLQGPFPIGISRLKGGRVTETIPLHVQTGPVLDYERIEALLERLIRLLRPAKQDRWVEIVADASKRILSPLPTTEAAGLDIVRSFFGGMGSLQDLVFSEEAGNIPDGYSAAEANDRFQTDLHELSKLIEW